jgi:hypothetical protein
MCPTDKHTIVELRSEDGLSLAPQEAYKNTQIRFTNMDFRGLLNDHPEADNGLWNVKVVYFGLYQTLGMSNCEAIDIQIDEITSPFTLSSRSTRGLTLGTANAEFLRDVDSTAGEDFLPSAFFIGATESLTQTCRINFTNWNVRLLNQRAEAGLNLQSLSGGGNTISHWVLRLELSPYSNHLDN